MKKIKTTEAIGHVLAHDITEIVPGKFKGRAFKKGHIVREADIKKLLSIGKEHLYILDIKEDELHEDDAAIILGELGKGSGVYLSDEIKEGKINFHASTDGLLKVRVDKLFELNMLGDISFATLPQNIPVKKAKKIAGARVIPLVINKAKLEQARALIDNKILSVLPYKNFKIGVVTTGGEVYHNRIQDKFGPVIKSKVEEYGLDVMRQIIVPDDKELIKKAIAELLSEGANLIICTGGMSVDPDDLTPTAIIESSGELISYGSPVLPGSMFLLAYLGEIPILGLPGCVMYSKRTIFDLVFPRIITGEKLTKADIMAYGHGGLCEECETCTFPNCNFGK